ncbi:MAG: rod shape-determining protein MreC [Gammaproteobacteria bacterium]
MARIAPGNTPKFAYIVLIIISSLLLYLDIQYKTFTPTKNLFNSGLLTSNLLVKNIIFNPIVNIYNVTRSKIDLVNTNTSLSNELELSRIENFLILNKDELFKNQNGLISFIKSSSIKNSYELAKVSSFDTNLYKCCDSHRLFLFNNIKPFKNGGTVINSQGILGQIASSNKRVSEVILLSDIDHSIPIKSNEFFCNASGTGRPKVIECRYDKSLWPESLAVGESFYTSGLGGVFPEGVLIGSVIYINTNNESEIILEIESQADPLIQNHVMVIYPDDYK